MTGKYNGVWAIAVEGGIHIGGEFTKVHGVVGGARPSDKAAAYVIGRVAKYIVAGQLADRFRGRGAPGGETRLDEQVQRGRSGHAWPFLSRQPIRPARQEGEKPTPSDSGS